VEGWLSDRFGGLPKDVTIDCSDDPLWPALVNAPLDWPLGAEPGQGSRQQERRSCRELSSGCPTTIFRGAVARDTRRDSQRLINT